MSYSEISNSAINILKQLELPKNPAIVFDIDDTLVFDSYSSGGMRSGCIPEIIKLYNTAKYLKISPIIITNRGGVDNVVKITLDLLKSCNITDFVSIYFRPMSNIQMNNPYTYKRLARQHATEQDNYNIVMSVGDQPWDVGDYGGIPIKLPSLV